MMGAIRERVDKVKELLVDWNVTTEFVQAEIGCGAGQARRAIRLARIELAEEGKRVSYAVPANGYTVTMEGDGVERTRSYVTRSQSIITQRLNHADVVGPSVDHGRSSKIERAISSFAMADGLAAQADQIRLSTLKELLT